MKYSISKILIFKFNCLYIYVYIFYLKFKGVGMHNYYLDS